MVVVVARSTFFLPVREGPGKFVGWKDMKGSKGNTKEGS